MAYVIGLNQIAFFFFWELLKECWNIVFMYNTGERSELDKIDNNEVKQSLYPSPTLNSHTRPHLWKILDANTLPDLRVSLKPKANHKCNISIFIAQIENTFLLFGGKKLHNKVCDFHF